MTYSSQIKTMTYTPLTCNRSGMWSGRKVWRFSEGS